MEEPHCIMFDVSTIKQEFIPEDDDLSVERILPKEEFVLPESFCEQRLDESDSLFTNNEIDMEGVLEEPVIQPIIKEELIIESEDTQEECVPSHRNVAVNQGVTQQEVCRRSQEKKCVADDSKKFQCDICNKVFGHKSNLTKHILIHSGIKKHQCEICKRAFTQKYALTKHKLIHSGERKFQCDICNNTYNQKSTLSNHKLIHSGIKNHKCNVCGKAFTYMCNLTVHQLIHSGIRKYKCEVCNKAFTSLSNLSIHSFIHSGIKKYKCDVCNKAFTQMSTLSKHKLTHSAKKTSEV